MPNYKQSEISGSTFNRFKRIVVVNEWQTQPSIIIDEERVLQIGDAVVLNAVGSISKQFDAAESVPMYNPSTGEKTGDTFDASALFAMVYSYAMHAAEQRDAAAEQAALIAAQPAPEA